MKIERAQELYNSKLEMVAYAQLNNWPELRTIKSTVWVLANKIGISRTEMQRDIDAAVPQLGPMGEGKLKKETRGLRKENWRTAPFAPNWKQDSRKRGWICGCC